MTTLIPQNEYVLCKKIENEIDRKQFFYYDKLEFPFYEVLKIGEKVDNLKFLNAGDKIICNSTGTKVHTENDDFYLFKQENIIGKIN